MFTNNVDKTNYAKKAEDVIKKVGEPIEDKRDFYGKPSFQQRGGYNSRPNPQQGGGEHAQGEQKYRFKFTTTQIRNILTLINQLYNDAILMPAAENSLENPVGCPLSKDFQSRFEYLRVRMVYESGRTPAIETFVNKAGLLKMHSEVGDSREKFILFCRYFEALVAYHKFYGGKSE
jgi:CRISPR-associated protein Csm2